MNAPAYARQLLDIVGTMSIVCALQRQRFRIHDGDRRTIPDHLLLTATDNPRAQMVGEK